IFDYTPSNQCCARKYDTDEVLVHEDKVRKRDNCDRTLRTSSRNVAPAFGDQWADHPVFHSLSWKQLPPGVLDIGFHVEN
ncbi:hypothetical protein STEG23_000490, partial [Scotinomys teguina]